jgi:hypothetical protein
MKMEHEKLGECKVFLEVTLNNGKCFKFVETYKIKKEKKQYRYRRWGNQLISSEMVWVDSRMDRFGWTSKKSRPHYYALWGNSHSEYTMGLTKLTDNRGRNISSSSASKKFFELIKASESITFSK